MSATTDATTAEKQDKLLKELLALEDEGTAVVWPNPGDRGNIIATVRGNLLSTIAEELRNRVIPPIMPDIQPPARPAGSSSDGVPHSLAGLLPVFDESQQYLIDLLDVEASGLSVVWDHPDDKQKALAARLAQFTDLSNLDIQPALPPSNPVDESELEWPNLHSILLDEPLKQYLDDFEIDRRRLRSGSLPEGLNEIKRS